ncbi:transcriptional regulator [Streptomyces sp. NPDC093109]|uniref:transcriptional regulator n=1 Tax=Streptomyces sp. NPDC093109 TaxID=3154977 RepID=UPI0034510113
MVVTEAGVLLGRILDQERCDAGQFLRRLAARHEALGLGIMVARPEKFSRWCSGTVPERRAQIAMADLLGVSPEQLYALGWPGWLRLAIHDEHALLASPWTQAGAVQALDALAHTERLADMERRAIIIAGGGALAAQLANWATATPAGPATSSGRTTRIDTETTDLIDSRLDSLRRLDDRVGSGQAYALARAELTMVLDNLKTASYSADTGHRLFAAAAEASRVCGWAAFDSGNTGIAERHYLAALRAAASAGDPVVTANTLSFWAMLRYSAGDPTGALQLVDAAHRHADRTGSGRMTAMLHARAARAHAKAGDRQASRRAEAAAFETYDCAGPTNDEPACVYWVDRDELHSWAASNALDLHDPHRALTHHTAITTTHHTPPDTPAQPRTAALRLTREADAHLALGNLDTAVHTAGQAVQILGGVASSRGNTIFAGLKRKLATHHGVPVVRDFLDTTR